MKNMYTHTVHIALAALLLAAALFLAACSGRPEPTPAATEPVGIPEGSYADGRGLELGFRLLYALDGSGGNGVLGTAGLYSVLAAAKNGAAGDTDAALTKALGMQEMTLKDINETALSLQQAEESPQKGNFASAWSLFVGDQQPVKESYLTGCGEALKMQTVFRQLDGQAGETYLNEWADEATGGLVKNVGFPVPAEKEPFFADLFFADPQWQLALDTGKSRPLPFLYEDGEEKAVPTMVCLQNCGIFTSPEGSMAVLPCAGDETRLVVLVPPDKTSLHDFMPVAAAKHDEWLGLAEWGKQRVLLPRFTVSFRGSLMPVLDGAGIGPLLKKGSDYSGVGEGLYFSDILHAASLTVDESGLEDPDPEAVFYQGIKDNIPTLAADRPFIVTLEKTDTGQILAMGFVRDPLGAASK